MKQRHSSSLSIAHSTITFGGKKYCCINVLGVVVACRDTFIKEKTEWFQQSPAHHLVCMSTGDSQSERTTLNPHSTQQVANELLLHKIWEYQSLPPLLERGVPFFLSLAKQLILSLLACDAVGKGPNYFFLGKQYFKKMMTMCNEVLEIWWDSYHQVGRNNVMPCIVTWT